VSYEGGGFTPAGLGLDEDLAVGDVYGAYPLGPFTASGTIYTGSGFLAGFTLMATTATIADSSLYDGSSAGGQQMFRLDVTQGEGTPVGPAFPGLRFRRGLYLNVNSGAPSLVVWIMPDAVRIG
jgi:hypothetical protein